MPTAVAEVSYLQVYLEYEIHTTALHKLHKCMTAGAMSNEDNVFRSRKPEKI
jgi:hypothetical protein